MSSVNFRGTATGRSLRPLFFLETPRLPTADVSGDEEGGAGSKGGEPPGLSSAACGIAMKIPKIVLILV